MKSAAVVNYAPEKGSVEIREIEQPEIGASDVLLEVAKVGVCGSDLHVLQVVCLFSTFLPKNRSLPGHLAMRTVSCWATRWSARS